MDDKIFENLERAKEIDGDPAERRKGQVKHESYEERANYRAECDDCGWVTYRIQLKQSQRRIYEGDVRGACPKCGSESVEWEKQ